MWRPVRATRRSRFAPHVEHVVASDITAEMLAEAGKLAVKRGLANVETAHAEAAGLPFPEESFDLVTCRLAAHHFPDPAGFVSESWRVLKPGGVFALVDNISPDTDILPGASREEADQTAADYNAYEKLRDPSHGRCLSLAEWSALLTRTGFADIRSEHMDQDIAFEPWTQRMRCDAATVVQLGPCSPSRGSRRSCVRARPSDGLTFTLQEAIVVAKKPAGPR